MFFANQVISRKTEVIFSLCIRNAIARTLFSFAIDCCLQTFTFLVYYKDLRFYLFLYLDKIVLRLCLTFGLILQFLAKYLGNLTKLFLQKIIFVNFFLLSNQLSLRYRSSKFKYFTKDYCKYYSIFGIFGYCYEGPTFTESIELNLSLVWCLVKCPISQKQIQEVNAKARGFSEETSLTFYGRYESRKTIF